MASDSRSRMISFRLTEEEFDRCRQLCFDQGIESVSEMARAAINLLLRQPERAPREALETRVADLEGRLRLLTTEMRRLDLFSSDAGKVSLVTAAVTSSE